MHYSIGTSPFQALYGRRPPPLVRYEWGSAANAEVDNYLTNRDALLTELKNHLHHAQQKMQQYANQKRRAVSFEVGEHVYVKLQLYKQTTIARKQNKKLAPRYYGPFPIEGKVGLVAYAFNLPATARIHNIFHVSQLKRAIGSHPACPSIPPTLTADLELIVEPLEVPEVRPGTTISETEVLISWKDSWESADVIATQFPSFNLDDKVALWATGNVRPPIQFTYTWCKDKDGKKVPSGTC